MRLTRSTIGIGSAVALLAGLAFGAGAAQAQTTPPATYYGAGLDAGATVEAFANGASCGTTTVTSGGEWVIVIADTAPCAPTTGAKVTFEVDGAAAAEQEAWSPGATPSNLQTGLSLTVSETSKPKTPTVPVESALVGTLPAQGFGLVTFGGSVDDLRTELGVRCSSGAPIFATAGGSFVGFFPTSALSKPNAAFEALYGAGLPAGTPLLGGNCG